MMGEFTPGCTSRLAASRTAMSSVSSAAMNSGATGKMDERPSWVKKRMLKVRTTPGERST